ncbi:hypothetical protein [Saccharospirillum salsuginis]|uniref:Uncharacterized protein n=1 Tax=Saccharospirillum salsuginis TaxID=418750 RepID=A0A918N812_9GAMM|nr:hypothetical protein [Saccharospirillum salsuginis]GGX46343.1 hypothetical protein GCM10007392_11770 [Saccharospirillum salsuginis]
MKAITHSAILSLILLGVAGCEQPNTTQEPTGTETNPSAPPSLPVYESAFRDTLMDRDGDGLPDDQDPAPDQPPVQPESGPALTITALASPRAHTDLPDTLIPGQTVVIDSTGLAQYGTPTWVRWHHADGILAQPVNADVQGRLTLTAPEVMAYGVSLVAGTYGSTEYPVQTQMAGAPYFYPVSEPLKAGQAVTLAGEALDRLADLQLGQQPVDILEQTSDSLRVKLPKQPLSDTFHWRDDRDRSHEHTLPVVRPVTLSPEPSLESPSEWSRLTDTGSLALDGSVTLWLPAGHTHRIRWHHDERPLSLSTRIGPAQTTVSVGARSTLETWLFDYHTGQGEQAAKDIPAMLARVADQLPEIQTALADALNGDAEAAQDAQTQFQTEVDDSLAWREPGASTTTVQPRWGVDYLSDTLDAIFAGGSLYQPIVKVTNQRAIPGRATYANVSVGSHRDLLTCGDLSNLYEPDDIWPSDLCVENNAPFYASLQVVDKRSGEVLTDHISHAFDAGILGGNSMGLLNVSTVAYLSGNNRSLCKMRPCRINAITGGFGWQSTSDLSQREAEIAKMVFGRTLLDRVLLPVLEWVTGLGEETDTVQCIAKELMAPSGSDAFSYLFLINDLKQKIDQANSQSQVITHTVDSLVVPVLDKLQGVATDPKFAVCMSQLASNAKSALVSNVANRLGQASKSASVPLAVANAVNQAYQGWQILIAPEKIVFDVAPRAAITEMTTSSGERTLYADSGTDFLRLYGTNLVDQTDTGYYPDLVLSDRSGNTARMAITASQVHDASDFSWTDLRITVNELTPLIDQLGGSRFDVTLEMDHADYSGFPDDVLPLPGTHFDWIGDARLIGTGSGLLRAGDYGVLFGENMESLDRADLRLALTSTSLFDTYYAESVHYRHAREIAFTLPDTLPAGEYTLSLEGYEGHLIGAESNLVIMPADASYLRILDNGPNQDDDFDLSLLASDGEPIGPNGKTGSVLIPTDAGSRDVSISWLDSELTNSEGVSKSLDQLEIECVDGGQDGVCTVRLVGELYIRGSVQNVDTQYTLSDLTETWP